MATAPLLQLPNTYRAFYGAFAALWPFQRDIITPILQGQDVIVHAATGSGKTAAVLAEGQSTIEGLRHIECGYENLEDSLRCLGVQIDKVPG